MMRPSKNKQRRYGMYNIEWRPDERAIYITPLATSVKHTPRFGLGNAVMQFNIDTPPKKVTKAITGDSDADGLLPPNFSYLPRWSVSLGGVQQKEVELPVRGGGTKRLEYPEASSAYIEVRHEAAYDPDGIGADIVGLDYQCVPYIAPRGSGGLAYDAHIFYDAPGYRTGFSSRMPPTPDVRGVFADGASNFDVDMPFGDCSNSLKAAIDCYMRAMFSDMPVKTVDVKIMVQGENATKLAVLFDNGAAALFDIDYKTVRLHRGGKLIEPIFNVARITKHHIYKYTGRFAKSGAGSAGLVPLLRRDGLDEDIVTILETPYGDGLVVLRGAQQYLLFGGKEIALQDEKVVGLLVDYDGRNFSLVIEDMGQFILVKGGARKRVYDFGYIASAVVKSVIRGLRWCTYKDPASPITKEFFDKRYKYAKRDSDWAGAGQTSNVVEWSPASEYCYLVEDYFAMTRKPLIHAYVRSDAGYELVYAHPEFGALQTTSLRELDGLRKIYNGGANFILSTATRGEGRYGSGGCSLEPSTNPYHRVSPYELNELGLFHIDSAQIN